MTRAGAVYVGNDAEIEFERRSGSTTAKLKRSNTTANRDRFSFRWADSVLQTGDRVRISRIDKGYGEAPASIPARSSGQRDFFPPNFNEDSNLGPYKNLVLQEGVFTNSIEHYCYVDELGRVYLYDTLTNALNQRGGPTGRVQLTQGYVFDWEQDYNEIKDTFSEPYQTIKLELREDNFRTFAKCLSYELTTNKDTIDCTTLGEYYYKQWENGLIGGQGTITALWDEQIVEGTKCSDPYTTDRTNELAAYFAKLILRIEIGAGFTGKFYLKPRDNQRQPPEDRWGVWWQADCVCTNVAVQATADALLQARIEFVTTGRFQLEIAARP